MTPFVNTTPIQDLIILLKSKDYKFDTINDDKDFDESYKDKGKLYFRDNNVKVVISEERIEYLLIPLGYYGNLIVQNPKDTDYFVFHIVGFTDRDLSGHYSLTEVMEKIDDILLSIEEFKYDIRESYLVMKLTSLLDKEYMVYFVNDDSLTIPYTKEDKDYCLYLEIVDNCFELDVSFIQRFGTDKDLCRKPFFPLLKEEDLEEFVTYLKNYGN